MIFYLDSHFSTWPFHYLAFYFSIFQENKGKIRVEALSINFWDYWDKLSVSMAAGEEPDVFLNDLGDVGKRAETGILLDLTPYLEADGVNVDEEYFDAFIEMCKLNDNIYYFPYHEIFYPMKYKPQIP